MYRFCDSSPFLFTFSSFSPQLRQLSSAGSGTERFRGLICPTCFHPSSRRVTVARNYANEIVFANGTRSSKGNYSRAGEEEGRGGVRTRLVIVRRGFNPRGRELRSVKFRNYRYRFPFTFPPITAARNNFFSLICIRV